MVKVTEIVDREFQDALCMAISSGSDKRRFSNHATDLIYCLRKAFARKVFPSDSIAITEYGEILRWMSGKGIQIGITNTLRLEHEIIVHYNPEDEESSGSVDFEFRGIPYELKTSLYSYATKPLPRFYATLQLMQYMASRNQRVGRIKMIYLKRFKDKATGRYMIVPEERTWQIDMTEADVKQRQGAMKVMDARLTESLNTGNWEALPMSNYDWECDSCQLCAWLKNLELQGLFKQHHSLYLLERNAYYAGKDAGGGQRGEQ